MNKKIVIPFALAILSAALFGCSSNKVKEEKIKPNPLPKLQQSIGLAPVFSQSVSSTSSQDPLRLQLAIDQGVYFLPDPKGVVSAYKGKQRLWEKRVSKQGITSGAEAAAGVVVVGNSKGEVFALDQATGEQKWKAQASGALLSPALIYNGRAILVANDSTVFAFDVENGQVAWTYKLPHTPLSLRAQAAPVPVDARTVAIGTSNGYVYAIDSLTGVPRMQQRVAVSEGRSDVQRLVDIAADPVVVGQFMVTTSFQGQVTVTDLTTQRVIWSQDASSVASPAVHEGKVFVSTIDGKVLAFDLFSGEKVWDNDQLLNRQLSNPVVLGNHVVVGDLDGVLHLLDVNNGQLLGRSSTSGDVRVLRVVDNQLLVSTRKGAMSIWQNR